VSCAWRIDPDTGPQRDLDFPVAHEVTYFLKPEAVAEGHSGQCGRVVEVREDQREEIAGEPRDARCIGPSRHATWGSTIHATLVRQLSAGRVRNADAAGSRL
jgi:methyl coenzyme M reductase gamma subunit